MRRSLKWAGLVGGVGCLVAVGLAAPAGAAAPKPEKGVAVAGSSAKDGITAEAKALMAKQAPLSAAAQRIQEAAVKLKDSGYTGISLDAAKGTVDVYWKGAVPEPAAKVIAAEKVRVVVKVHGSKYSRSELKQAEATLMKHIKANPGPMFGVRVPVEGTGVVALSTDPDGAAQRKALAAKPLPKLGLPVTLEQGAAPAHTARQNDVPNYWGGGTIINRDKGGLCSSGFGVTRNNVNYILTAGHCGGPGDFFINGNGSRTLGFGAFENVGHDLLLISTEAGNRIFDGGGTKVFETRGQFSKGVAGWGTTFAGEVVCQSGTISGAVCDIKNTNNLSFSYCNGSECYSSLVYATRVGVAVRGGDSGGPVFTLSGTSRVIAKGINSGQTWFPITVSYNGRCLDADANNLGVNGTRLQLWQCNGTPQQQFIITGGGNIVSLTSAQQFCVDVDPATAGTNGGRIYLWTCNGSAQQQFNYGGNGPGDMRVSLNGRCVDADLNQINTNGARVQIWDCNGSNQQKWNVSTGLVYQDFGTAVADFNIAPLISAS